jgi:hypothetical protein
MALISVGDPSGKREREMKIDQITRGREEKERDCAGRRARDEF